ncbi:hypothetical protein [Streptomyces monashensis]|uniref:hypothetical protein n=1 Tax=Streptomyces monashensis TaxID=1678012 RepID=UPI003F53E815
MNDPAAPFIATELTPYTSPTATPCSTPVAGVRCRRRARRTARAWSRTAAARAGTATMSRLPGCAVRTVCPVSPSKEATNISRAAVMNAAPARSRPVGRSPNSADDSRSSRTSPAVRMPCAAAMGRVR